MAEKIKVVTYKPRIAAFTGWTIFFFVLLRVAIGWHFLYEGIFKLKEGTFSATPYLLASQGPLKNIFRSMVFDADGFKRMGASRSDSNVNMEYQIDQIKQRSEQATKFYNMTEPQNRAWSDFTDAQIKEMQSLGMPRAEIDKKETNAAGHLRDALGHFGDNLTSLMSLATSPEDTFATTLVRMEKNGVRMLPVFNDDQFVGVIQEGVIRIAATQPAADGKDPMWRKVKEVMVNDDQRVSDYVLALNAADYQDAVESYKLLLSQVASEETKSDPQYKAQRLDFNRKKVNSARSALITRAEKGYTALEPVPVLDKITADTREKLLKDGKTKKADAALSIALTSEQRAKGAMPALHLTKFPGKYLNGLIVGRFMTLRFAPKTLTFWIDLAMMFGLIAVGICLILGLFTRFAAFCGILMLTMFYFSMPPWPGTVDPPNVEGHYWFINKNLIELIACLMIMCSRVGRYLGFDAFFWAISDYRRRKRAEREAVQVAQLLRERLLGQSDPRAAKGPVRA